MNDPTALTLREAADAIARGTLRAEALAEACLDRGERLQPKLNCFIRVTAEQARSTARAADQAVKAGRPLGPLHGIPLAHKDMFYRAGEACSCGSKIRADFVPDHTATVLTRPSVGLMPTTPQAAAGKRTDPPVSEPSAPNTRPTATAAPDPDDEPPVM